MLCAAERETEAGDDFIEDQEDVAAGAFFAQEVQEAGGGRDAAAIGEERLGEDGADGGVVVQGFEDLGGRVPFGDYDVIVRELAAAYRVGGDGRFRRGVVADQSLIRPAVVVAFELEVLVATGDGAGEAEGNLDGFGAGVGIGDEIRARDEAAEAFGDFVFEVALGSVGGAAAGLGLEGGGDGGVGMAENERAPGEGEVDIAVAIDVFDGGAAGALEVERVGFGEAAETAGDATGERLFGASVASPGLGRFGLDGREDGRRGRQRSSVRQIESLRMSLI